MTGAFIRERRGRFGYRDTDSHRGKKRKDKYLQIEADNGAMGPRGQGMPRITHNHQKPGGGKEGFFPTAIGGIRL